MFVTLSVNEWTRKEGNYSFNNALNTFLITVIWHRMGGPINWFDGLLGGLIGLSGWMDGWMNGWVVSVTYVLLYELCMTGAHQLVSCVIYSIGFTPCGRKCFI